MKRVGERGSGEFERISWDEATDLVAANINRIKEQYGNTSIYIPYGTGSYNQMGGKWSADRLMNMYGGALGYIDLFLAGPPCQGFSTAGLKSFEDPRNTLFSKFVSLIKEVRPKRFLIENVPGLGHQPVFNELEEKLISFVTSNMVENHQRGNNPCWLYLLCQWFGKMKPGEKNVRGGQSKETVLTKTLIYLCNKGYLEQSNCLRGNKHEHRNKLETG